LGSRCILFCIIKNEYFSGVDGGESGFGSPEFVVINDIPATPESPENTEAPENSGPPENPPDFIRINEELMSFVNSDRTENAGLIQGQFKFFIFIIIFNYYISLLSSI